jgi:hypothetical protein
MKNSVTARNESLTPEIILGILRDSHLQQCQYDPEAEPGISLTFESSIEMFPKSYKYISHNCYS